LQQNSTIVLLRGCSPLPHATTEAKPVAKPARKLAAVAARVRPMRSLPKGKQTSLTIVDAALGLCSKMGLEGLSIGTVAEATHMSKSGVFAHIGSREELQISVVHEYYRRFTQEVFSPALQEPRGLPRLKALFANWMKRVAVEIESGCIFISGAVEFDDRPGPVHDVLVSSVQTWRAAMLRAIATAQQCGHLQANADAEQIAFEIHGLILALHYEARFLKNPGAIERANQGFNHILARYAASPATVSVTTKE
jgi:AcrR family transcriptional regulator